MQFNVVFITTALLASSFMAMSATVTLFTGAECIGSQQGSLVGAPSGECVTFGSGSTKSISYSGVLNAIEFFISGGSHDACTNGASLVLGGGSGCATAPAGVNWESFAFI